MHRSAPGVVVLFALAVCARGQAIVLGAALPAGWAGLAGDVDGDGRVDYMTQTSTQFLVHSGVTGAAWPFLARSKAAPNDTAAYVPVGDVDADGRDDLAYAYGGLQTANYVTVVSGADGTTLWTWNLPPPSSPAQLAVPGGADFDADGCSDVVLRYANGAAMNVTEVRSGRTGSVLFQHGYQLGGAMSYWFQPIGDCNGDGYEDLAIAATSYANPTQPSVAALLGPDLATAYPIGTSATLLGDTNGNGTVDFFVSNAPFAGIQDGNGSVLWTATSSSVRGWPLGDLDGDGGADVRIDGSGYQAFSGRTLTPLPGVAPTAQTWRVGDIDGDGRDEAYAYGAAARYEWSDPAVPTASRLLRRGVAGTTSSGRRPHMETRGHAGLGHQLFLDLRGAEPGSAGVLVVGPAIDVDLTPWGAAGNRAFADPQASIPLAADGHGLAGYRITMPNSGALLGATSCAQCAVLDPAANALGIVTSTAVDVETRN